MRSRRIVLVAGVLLFALAACGGHQKKVGSSTQPTSSAPGLSSPTRLPAGVPKVMLQIGISYQSGVLVRYCQGSSCRQATGTQAKPLAATDPLLFIIDQRPSSAQVLVTPVGKTVLSDSRALHVGTTMLYAPEVKPGTYLVRLEATWKGRTATWVFSIKVPKS
jgi:hypothetical protein